MAVNNSYQPKEITNAVVATTLPAPIKTADNVGLTYWDLIFINGKATNGQNGALASAAILLATGSPVSVGNAKYITFTDSNGVYGITVAVSNNPYYIKIYS